jgi:hypothetical protein
MTELLMSGRVELARCWYCGTHIAKRGQPFEGSMNVRKATIDHKIPRCKGGSDTPGNLVWACGTCNSTKGTKTLEEYRRWVLQKHARYKQIERLSEVLKDELPIEAKYFVSQALSSLLFDHPYPEVTFYGEIKAGKITVKY